MELLFVSVQHGSRIGGMTFVHGEASQGDLGFRCRLFLPRLVPSSPGTLRTTFCAAARSPRSLKTSPSPVSTYAIASLSSISWAVAFACW